MPPQIIVKALYNSELKRISFINAQAFTYDKLHAEFARMFNLTEPYKVYYTDDDMDEVTVTSNQDLAEALSMFQSQQISSNKGVTCRFTIKKTGHKAQNFVDHLEREMSFIQDSAQSSASAIAAAASAAANTATTNWQRAFNPSPPPPRQPFTATNQSVPAQQPETALHTNVMCDHCYRAVRGTRWKCQDCRDYDLCDGCKTAGQHNHPSYHRFSAMQSSSPSTSNSHPHSHRHSQQNRPRGFHRNRMPHLMPVASCDFCDSVISGTRYKCKDCPDFDLCERCIALADTQHPGHAFEITRTHRTRCAAPPHPPTPVTENSTNYHAGVRCDGCDKWIYGIRYKCGNCEDFDLCSKCEATEEHNPHHVFLKVKKPLNKMLSNIVPLLPSLYQEKREFPSFAPPQMKQREGAQSITTASLPRSPNASSSRTVDQSSVNELDCKLERLSVRSLPSVASSSTPILEKPSEVSASASVASLSQPELFARFVDDVNIPDGTIVAAKSRFLKIWNMVNEGTQEWPQGTQLVFCGGDSLASSPSTTTFAVPVTKPGKNAYVTADLQAPAKPGRYVSYFRLITPTGTRFGHRVWCDILVENEEQQGSSTASSVMIYPTLTNRDADDEDKATIRTEDGSSHHARSVIGSSVVTPSVRSISDSEDNESEDSYSGYEVYADPEAPGTPDEAKDYIVIEQEEEEEETETFHHVQSVPSNPFLTEKEQQEEVISNSKIEEAPQDTLVVSSDPALEAELKQLHDMGFYHDTINVELLKAFNHNMEEVVMELLRLQQ
ncbi:hypothetical protein BC943DRAFT_328101 [Umbelopsis sp. AD052]|nr:hypothetical protein BC943DRAFT_328101 [Umbelopsis sp. AD052]